MSQTLPNEKPSSYKTTSSPVNSSPSTISRLKTTKKRRTGTLSPTPKATLKTKTKKLKTKTKTKKTKTKTKTKKAETTRTTAVRS